jgi:hypothetical protein
VVALPSNVNCLKVKIFTKSNVIELKEKGSFVIHFQLENCSSYNLPIDFYANLGYPEDSTCNIYFQVMKLGPNGKYVDYKYQTVDYRNGIDSVIRLRSHRIYSFYMPLFEVYGIKETGSYRIQGFYRFINDAGEYFVQGSDYLDIVVK